MNSVGACMLAATVWPTSTLREMTRPSIGARDDRVLKVDVVLVERRPRLRDLRLRGADLRVDRSDVDLRRLEVALRDQLPARQLLRARELRAGVIETDLEAIEIGLRANQVRARLFNLGLEEGRVEPWREPGPF